MLKQMAAYYPVLLVSPIGGRNAQRVEPPAVSGIKILYAAAQLMLGNSNMIKQYGKQ